MITFIITQFHLQTQPSINSNHFSPRPMMYMYLFTLLSHLWKFYTVEVFPLNTFMSRSMLHAFRKLFSTVRCVTSSPYQDRLSWNSSALLRRRYLDIGSHSWSSSSCITISQICLQNSYMHTYKVPRGESTNGKTIMLFRCEVRSIKKII